jgi:hypothetical protein
MQCKVYSEQHLNAKVNKLIIHEWAPKLINAMWDHTTRLWHYPNNAVHSRDSKSLLSLRSTHWKEKRNRIKNKHKEMRHKLHEFQSRHLERLTDIEQLHYNGQKCWADLARLYLEEAETHIIPIRATIEQYLHGCADVG